MVKTFIGVYILIFPKAGISGVLMPIVGGSYDNQVKGSGEIGFL